MAKKIISIQHTQSAHHGAGLIGSWNDWDLTELGHQHAENIGRKLSEELNGQEWKIYSSDQARAKQTVEPLARYMNLEINLTKGLREMNLLDLADLCKPDHAKTSEWFKANTSPTNTHDCRNFPQAESFREFWNRIAACCNEIINDPAENIIIVSHGMSMSVWQSVWLGFEIHDYRHSGHAGGVSFMQITDDGERIINRWNDTYYMN